jgi:AraC-like DNA-binding protein
MNNKMGVAEAAYEVGYVSASHLAENLSDCLSSTQVFNYLT